MEIKRGELAEKRRVWDGYRRDNGITQVSNPMDRMLERIEYLEEEREKANRRLGESQSRLQQLQSTRSLVVPAFNNNNELCVLVYLHVITTIGALFPRGISTLMVILVKHIKEEPE